MRTTLAPALASALTFALLAARTDAALIHFTEPVDPENYIAVDVDVHHAQFRREYWVSELPTSLDNNDWTAIEYVAGGSFPDLELETFWILKADPLFGWRLGAAHNQWVEPNLSAFVAAGDSTLELSVDERHNGDEPWHVFQWASPNLGAVEVVYDRKPFGVPEPAGFVLALLALAVGRLIRR